MRQYNDEAVGAFLSQVAARLNDALPEDWIAQRKAHVERILSEKSIATYIVDRIPEHFDFLNGRGPEPALNA